MIHEFAQSLQTKLSNLLSTTSYKQINTITDDLIRSLILENINTAQIQRLQNKITILINSKTLTPASKTYKTDINALKNNIYATIYNELIEMMRPSKTLFEPEIGTQNVVVFVGLQGSGKTTTICKYGYYYKKRGYKVGIVCADTFRAGAFDQIVQNTKSLGIPYYGNTSETDAITVALEGVAHFENKGFDLILIDTSGRHTRDTALFIEMQTLITRVCPNNITLIMDAGIGAIAEDVAKGFKEAVTLGSIILSKMDGAEKSGGVLSAVCVSGCPVSFIGTGEGMNDFEVFVVERYVKKLLGKGDLEGYLEKIKYNVNMDSDKNSINELDLMNKMKEGKISFIEIRSLIIALKRLGPFSEMLKMIPGFSNLTNKSFKSEERNIEVSEVVMNSLSRKELEGDGSNILNNINRLKRISVGCGVDIKGVKGVIESMNKVAGMWKDGSFIHMMSMFEGFNQG
ncbi:Signal recognition particle 54 kDa protein 2 [Cucumispora dikerogammari]|nr:Signal recognition particle 54 kDa protein 2 [Cucumispora dikerogammari]